MTKDELKEVLRLHGMWVRKEPGGIRANLSGVNLSRANLSGADLKEADLTKANLSGANLIGANLIGANLSEANLIGANLSEANLRGADLTGADLRWANLSKADITEANFYGADLSGANLTGANLTGANLTRACLRGANLTGACLTKACLTGANLRDANLTDAILPSIPVTLPPGDFIGWKKVRGDVILELRIFESSRRTGNLVGIKCRADQVLVLSAQGPDGFPIEGQKTFQSLRDPSFTYTVGDIVGEPSFSDDIRVECASGIHFFLSREEAVEFSL